MLLCLFAIWLLTYPCLSGAQPSQATIDVVNAVVTSAQQAQNSANQALAAALDLQRRLGVAPAAGAMAPGPTMPPTPPPPAAPMPETFAVPGYEQKPPSPVVGLAAPSAEIQQVVSEQGGLPSRAIPAGLPERLSSSLQGQSPLVGSG